MVATESSLCASGAPIHAPPEARAARLRRMAIENFQFIWRSLRRLGVDEHAVDDAAQQVFEVASRKLDEIAEGRERAYLFMTGLRVASEARRRARAAAQVLGDDTLADREDPAPWPDEHAERGRRRRLLDELLDAMPLELRSVFVLFELEGASTAEIAQLLEIPVGTAASRLRRAREEFQAAAKRLRAKSEFPGGRP